jgi:hypothetical protein
LALFFTAMEFPVVDAGIVMSSASWLVLTGAIVTVSEKVPPPVLGVATNADPLQ